MKARRILAAVLAALFIAATGGAQALQLNRDQALIDTGSINAFAKENLASFTTATLTNGIPVIMKRSTTNRVVTVKAVLRGQVSLTPVQKAGLEAVMLTLMTRGSEHYPYADVQRRLFEDSTGISPNSGSFDMSSLDLVSIDTYFDDLLAVFADAFLHPKWNADEFPRVISNMKIARQQADADPFSLAVRLLHESFFAGHPYAASWDGAGSSLDNITLEDVKSYYARNVGAGRIFLVAVGNFDPQKLLSSLNATFGAMPAAPYARPPLPAFQGAVKPDLIVKNYPQSQGLAYIRGDFAMPGPDSPDYPAALMAFNLLNDVLFEVVRTRNGASYGASATMHGFTASYGDITIFKTTVPGKVKPLVDQAISVLASGKSMGGNVTASAAGKSGIGAAAEAQASPFVPIADALPFYKAEFVTGFYSGQETNTSIASQIASSLVYHGDYRDYLLVLDRIQAVTADDVVRVTKKYLVGNPTLWIALGDPALLAGVKKEDFVGAAAKSAGKSRGARDSAPPPLSDPENSLASCTIHMYSTIMEAMAVIQELGEEIASLSAHLDAATHRLLECIRRFDLAGGWHDTGALSCAHWLAWRVGWDTGTAREKVRVARALGELAAIDDALLGKLSYAKVRALTRVATPVTEPKLLEMALLATGAQLERLCRGCRGVLAAKEPPRREDRTVDKRLLPGGMVKLELVLEPDEADLILRAVDRAREVHAEAQPPAAQPATPGPQPVLPDQPSCEPQGASAETSWPSRADGAVTLAESFLAGHPVTGSGGERFQVMVHLDQEVLAADGTWSAVLEDGSRISAETFRRVACDCGLVAVGHSGQALDIGRRTRSIPPAIRRALMLRDQGCAFPGCTNSRFLHAHHIDHWLHGGRTRLDNLALLCTFHHHLVHEGGWTVTAKAEGGCAFHSPRCNHIIPEPPRERVDNVFFWLHEQAEERDLDLGPEVNRPRWDGKAPDYDWAVGRLLDVG